MSNIEVFQQTVNEAVKAFPTNNFCQLIDNNKLTLENYHNILLMIFHQTFETPSTFALAGAHCSPSLHTIREYLLQHADEEKLHWEWVISDLKNTNYIGKDPRLLFAKPACAAYVAFNVYTAIRMPIARLAIAATLESIGAAYGKMYATKISQILKLTPDQVYFFFGHGDTDIGHTADIFRILNTVALSPSEWDWMCHAAKTAGVLYTAMYNEAMK